MGYQPCRMKTCETLRSNSVDSEDGIHISECSGCGDSTYIEAHNQPQRDTTFTVRELELMQLAYTFGAQAGLDEGAGLASEDFDEWVKRADFVGYDLRKEGV